MPFTIETLDFARRLDFRLDFIHSRLIGYAGDIGPFVAPPRKGINNPEIVQPADCSPVVAIEDWRPLLICAIIFHEQSFVSEY
jgi:hypothetical protein